MPFTLITGASTGIGKEFAHQLAAEGHSLILVARSETKLLELAKTLQANHGIDVRVIVQDLALQDSAKTLFETCQNRGYEVNCLINNAGVGIVGEFERQDLFRIEQMLALNVCTLTALTSLFLPQIKRFKGIILNVGSNAGFQPVPYMAAYAATKAYVLHFSEALASELEGSGVHVMVLAPGTTKTNFFNAADYSLEAMPFPPQPVEEVVAQALKGMAKKKTLIVPGWRNRISNFAVRLAPRFLVRKVSKFLMRNLKKK